MIHCALCLHDSSDRYKMAYCALLSCFENASEKVHVHAFIDASVALISGGSLRPLRQRHHLL